MYPEAKATILFELAGAMSESGTRPGANNSQRRPLDGRVQTPTSSHGTTTPLFCWQLLNVFCAAKPAFAE